MRRTLGLVSNSDFCSKDRGIRLALATTFTVDVSVQGLVNKLRFLAKPKNRRQGRKDGFAAGKEVLTERRDACSRNAVVRAARGMVRYRDRHSI
jgi:hypothetical protein